MERTPVPGQDDKVASMDEPVILVEHREQLLFLLEEAAEIEHGLMCCYLYTLFSLITR